MEIGKYINLGCKICIYLLLKLVSLYKKRVKTVQSNNLLAAYELLYFLYIVIFSFLFYFKSDFTYLKKYIQKMFLPDSLGLRIYHFLLTLFALSS